MLVLDLALLLNILFRLIYAIYSIFARKQRDITNILSTSADEK